MRRCGFALLEMVAVLVLLALLAAFLLPALAGYIRQAKEQSIIASARSALLAAQTLLSERYAAEECAAETALTPLIRRGVNRAPALLSAEELLMLAEIPPDDVENIWLSWDEHASVTRFVWTERSGMRSAVWDGKQWSVRDGKPLEENPDGFGNKD